MSRRRKHRERYSVLGKQDYHHLLFQCKHWQQGYAKLLRNHPYMGKYIPMATLHRLIHSKIHDVPTPNGKECKLAYKRIVELEANGEIDIVNDDIAKRLGVLIDLWRDTCPATVAVLEWQRDLIASFYEKGG